MRRAVAQHTNTADSRVVQFNYKAKPSSGRSRSKTAGAKHPDELVHRIFGRMQRCNQKAIEKGDDIDVDAISVILGSALADRRFRPDLIRALAYFVGRALDGHAPNMARYPEDPALK